MKPQQQTHSLVLPTTTDASSSAEAALLHSVRKSSAKPWKKPITPLLRAPTKIYCVDPGNFKDLVQKLTGAPKPTLSTRVFQPVVPQPVKIVGTAPSSVNDDHVPLPLLPYAMTTNQLQGPSAAKPLSFSYGDLGHLGFSFEPIEPTPLAWS